jgi:hypothetical protein
LVIVDNGSRDQSATVARRSSERAHVVQSATNVGFGGGCQLGASATSAPLLLFLNPDSHPQAGCLDRLRAAASEHPRWGAWQAAVMLPDGDINTDGGVVHYLGVGWSGDCGKPAATLPAGPREVAFASGAALTIRRVVWERLGGFDHSYFMYSEDLDLGLRLWLAGYEVGVVPAARVVHRYEFDKGPQKWFWLERNRWRTILSVYPLPLLVALAPALLAAELAIVAIAARDGWLQAKLRAQAAVLADLPRTLARRRTVQATRQISVQAFASRLTASLDSGYLPVERMRGVKRAQWIYWAVVRTALRR